jgi:hypothetical protein
MSDVGVPVGWQVPLHARCTRAFAWFVIGSAVAGGAGALAGAFAFAVIFYPFYLVWIVSDLRQRGVGGVRLVGELLLAVVPAYGLLLYLVWTRRFAGMLQCVAITFAVAIPAGLAFVLTRALVAFANGERF